MRLTNSMITRDYLKSLNSSLKDMNDMNNRITAKRSFMSFSEDPVTAMKSMKVRQGLTRIDVYTRNLSSAQDILTQYESTISNINSLVTEALAQVSQGITGTGGESVRKTVANALRGFQDSILAAANTKYAGDYIFGGDNVGTAPFSVSEDGKLLYKGQDVDTAAFEPEDRYIDIGIGISKDSDGKIIPQSALNISVSGAMLLGSGVDSNGITNNLYNLLGIIADKLENNDLDDINLYHTKLDAKSDEIRMQYVNVGEKANYISFFTDRLGSEKFNLQTRQSELESIKIEEAIISFSEMELAYNACLQMGTKILQPSLLDFLR
jgi:flagellar hook-associated protein 3 FlgL